MKVSGRSGTCLVIFLLGSCCPRMQETLTCSHSVQQKGANLKHFRGCFWEEGWVLNDMWMDLWDVAKYQTQGDCQMACTFLLLHPSLMRCVCVCVLDSYCVVELHPYLMQIVHQSSKYTHNKLNCFHMVPIFLDIHTTWNRYRFVSRHRFPTYGWNQPTDGGGMATKEWHLLEAERSTVAPALQWFLLFGTNMKYIYIKIGT